MAQGSAMGKKSKTQQLTHPLIALADGRALFAVSIKPRRRTMLARLQVAVREGEQATP